MSFCYAFKLNRIVCMLRMLQTVSSHFHDHNESLLSSIQKVRKSIAILHSKLQVRIFVSRDVESLKVKQCYKNFCKELLLLLQASNEIF